jgi:hypothetical protein
MPYERKTFDLVISEELRSVLSEIESDSQVAKLLLKKRHDKDDLVEDPINFISVAHDKTKISYLTTDRIAKIEDPSQYWSSSRRFAAKPGGFISKLFKDIPAKEVEKFSNLYRAQSNKPKFELKIVEGGEILKYYHYKSYLDERGTLGASCMKHDSCQNFLDIYINNNNIVKMLVMLNNDGMLMGRALLWNFDSNKIMDRIYTISDEELVFHFKKWATDNGYLYKSEQNWYNTLNFENLSTSKQELKLKIKLNNSSVRRFPYVDTFKFLDEENGLLLNYIPDGDFRTLCASDGSKYGSDYLIFDGIDRVLRHRGDSVYLRYLDIRTHANNARYSDINDEYILHKDCNYDEDLGDYIFNKNNDKYNNAERIQERRDYLKNRREEMEKRESSSRSKKRNSWIEEIINNNDLSAEGIREVYNRMTSMTGIPRDYFGSFDYFDASDISIREERQETQSEDHSEPTQETEITEL